ncbi:MAG TPA: class I SAM-dependent methyltransferase [Nocardioides sp.]|uniref:SAM-dependent methyltransferase n=1 Tax=Nocardioides sp. TaxID=35761 RepID=UPI002BEFC294|nr:class I SAM-dependent methyltransferase [Nocardioides sp.]HTW14862.1 class I SAM-dependent methyltransferase [Nocardioides sp.]
MSNEFDREFWEERWRSGAHGSMAASGPHPALRAVADELEPGTALDAGCGSGAEASWLAAAGWRVTAVDIAESAIAQARERTAGLPGAERIEWFAADLTTWTPEAPYDLVATHYAHPAMPQLDFYDRIADWVAPGGTLLIVGHRHHEGHGHEGHGHDHDGPPAAASVTAATVTDRLDPTVWTVRTTDEVDRVLTGPGGRPVPLHDVVVRAVRTR